ncbi:hypothetical protein CQW23_05932 [Capsicum baccatum]|uniref:Uncharacterized protein n=1 Tax=Capsicum baccatum TaxID=33114 RepID=A0A2G2XIX6_CAPBA|nr:hypothetical protein CQW23_05932 [Capsicum baccatum]
METEERELHKLTRFLTREGNAVNHQFGSKSNEGQTEGVIFDHLHSTAFQYSSLGRTILGPAQIEYKYNHHKSSEGLHPRMVRVIDDDIPLAQFAVVFQGAPWTDPDTIAINAGYLE